MGKSEQRHKQDLAPYECALAWQDGCNTDEALCILANLVSLGAIRAYLSDEHRKVVFSRDVPFPAVTTWGAKC
eukprot:NODE_18253_length_902_cov_5.420645.p3 GENE.NODE_18253_length_902_cov_5.420645~~NODE_18253_length_902_cov_5.420645.p3  ORF type:complete len:73 (-),score=15.66 NODE_18253_length_902_cov_5.420645:264-482(-)